jgi:hypothetical protein
LCYFIGLLLLNTADDADGDHIRCRWAESQLQECGEVCRVFPAILSETDVSLITIALQELDF